MTCDNVERVLPLRPLQTSSRLILQGRKWVFYRWKIWGIVTTPRSCSVGIEGKARNRILLLNPGQGLYSLDYTNLIALNVCLLVCLFRVKNNGKIKTVTKIPYPPNQRLAGQVNFRWLPRSPTAQEDWSSCDGMTWMCTWPIFCYEIHHDKGAVPSHKA